MAGNSDFEVLLRTFFQNKSNGDTLEKAGALLNTPEGRKLLSDLSGSGGDALKKAAASAAEKQDPSRALIASLMSSRDGMALMRKVTDLGKR